MNTPRKGAGSIAAIPPEVLQDLNEGRIESRTLAEGLAIDHVQLLRAVAPDLPEASHAIVSGMGSAGITRRMELIGSLLQGHFGLDSLPRFAEHRSDTARGWACYMIGLAPRLKFKKRLQLLRHLADDSHFGVREWAWMAIRSHLVQNISQAIDLLTPWVCEDSANLRRFAVEATRPRGVWCVHLEQLKRSPELGLPILEPVKADLESYVQDSVANWLNDASKSDPDWVTQLCQRWKSERNHPATERICQRALRTLRAR